MDVPHDNTFLHPELTGGELARLSEIASRLNYLESLMEDDRATPEEEQEACELAFEADMIRGLASIG